MAFCDTFVLWRWCILFLVGVSNIGALDPLKVVTTGPVLPSGVDLLGYELLPFPSESYVFIFSLRLNETNNTMYYYGSLLRLDGSSLEVKDQLALPGPVPTLDDYKFYRLGSGKRAICLGTLWVDDGFAQTLMDIDLEEMKVTKQDVISHVRTYDNVLCPCSQDGDGAVILDRFSLDTLQPVSDTVNRSVILRGEVEVTDLATAPGLSAMVALARSLQSCEVRVWEMDSWKLSTYPVNCTYYKAFPTALVAGTDGLVSWGFDTVNPDATPQVALFQDDVVTTAAPPNATYEFDMGTVTSGEALYAVSWPFDTQERFWGTISRFDAPHLGGCSQLKLENTTLEPPVELPGGGACALAITVSNPQPPPTTELSDPPPKPSTTSIYPVHFL